MTNVAAFTSLTSTDHRDFLSTLVTQLTPYEWRDLKELLSVRDFHLDIIGNLPVEMAISVFSYLAVGAPFRCQRVCKRWRKLLSDLHVLQTLIAPIILSTSHR